ncbi:MAG: hypothetical protein PHP98_10665 [Kiritimatiellae bacterium]|nr:hypothetical protein [Kiritimatiellia bacterium]
MRSDCPEDLSPYWLIIHCGGCVFNRRELRALQYILPQSEKRLGHLEDSLAPGNAVRNAG